MTDDTKEQQAEARVLAFRREQVPQLEQDAIQAEVRATQWERIGRDLSDPSQMAAGAQAQSDAQARRAAADKLHELAGTRPEQFYVPIAKVLRIQAQGVANELPVLQERADHPDIYGGEASTLKFDVAANAALVEALLTKADELEAIVEEEN